MLSDFAVQAFPWYQAIVVFAGYFVLGVAGFGSALIIIPLLAWQWPLSFIVPLVLLMDVPTSLLHTGLNLQKVAWRELPPLLPALVVGAALGLALVQLTTGPWLQAVLGLYICWVGLKAGKGPSRPAVASHRAAPWAAGLMMGLVEVTFGTAGPVVVAWLGLRLQDPQALRATLPTTIVIVACLALLGFAFAGKLSQPEIWTWLAVLIPFAALGVWCGHQVAVRINPSVLKPLIYGLLTVSGMALIVKSLRF